MAAENTELTKEQKQTIMFGALVIGGIIYCIWTFGITPLGVEFDELSAEMKTLKADLTKAQGLKRSKDNIDTFLAENKAKLNEVLSKMPPRNNPMVWSAGLVRKICQKVDIPPDMRTSRGVGPVVDKKKKKKKGPEDFFEQYTVEVNLICSYHKLGKFVAELEREVPFSYVSHIRIGQSSEYKGDVEASVTCVFPRLSKAGDVAVKGGLKL